MSHRDLPFEDDVIDRLARIEERIAPVADLGIRVRRLELQRSYLAGAMAVVAATASAVFVHFPKLF